MGRSRVVNAKSASPNVVSGAVEDILSATIAGPSHSDKQRTVMLYGIVDEQMVGNVIAGLLHLSHTNSKPISLIISTYGGAVDELYALYDVMKMLPCEVQTVGIGKVMSAGCHLLAAGVKGKRLVTPSTRLMVHPVQLSGQYEGSIWNVQASLKESLNTQERIVQTLVKETGTPRARFDEIMNLGHDYYMSAQEAIELGIADVIVGE